MTEITTRRIKGNANVTMRSVYFGTTEAENFAAKQPTSSNRSSPTQKKIIQNIVR